MVGLTDRPDMTLDVYRGRKTTIQLQQLQPRDFSQGLENEFETAVVNEPSVFEPLKFYCMLHIYVHVFKQIF